MREVDHTIPEGKWAFDDQVTNVFEDMLSRSIPQYEVMRKAVFDTGRQFLDRALAQGKHSIMLDLGCSRGEALAPFVYKYGAQVYFVGVEVSDPMLQASRQRFSKMIDAGVVEIRSQDLRTDY